MPASVHTSSASHTFRPTPTPSSVTATATQIVTSTPVLRLHATGPPQDTRRNPRIHWAEDVVDNEGLGRKRSKVCCIYHAPHPVGESSDDSTSSSSSDGDSSSGGEEEDDDDDRSARMAGRRKGKERSGKQRGHHHHHHHHHHDDGDSDHTHGGDCDGSAKQSTKSRSRNAYEKMPKPRKGAGEAHG